MTQRFSLAFVTGASSGIGFELCRLLAREGIALVVTGRNAEHLKALADELQPLVPVEIAIADMAVGEDRQRLVAIIQEKAPDLIINNAGFGLYGRALSYETKAQQAIIDVNVSGVLELTLEGARALLTARKRGVILNVSSSADQLIFPGLAVYAASKAFVSQFSRSLDEEMQPYGIRILVSCPGVVATGFRGRASGLPEAKTDKFAMSASFAAKELWQQIIKRKQVHVFDWKTRIATFLARFILPQALVSGVLMRKIESYCPARPLIKK